MHMHRRIFHTSAVAAALSLAGLSGPALSAGAEDLNKDAAQALETLYRSQPTAEVIAKRSKAVKYLATSTGWELVIGQTVVVVNEGIARDLSAATLKDDACAFISDQRGLMASLIVEGTKISRIQR